MATQTKVPNDTQPALDLLAAVWCQLQDGRGIVDDLSGRPIRGIEHYADLLDLDNPVPLSAIPHELPDLPLPRYADLEAETRELVAREGDQASSVDAARTRERLIKATALIARHALDMHTARSRGA
ncbi:hypothetical protein VSS74_15195 [Conexibacter stalactiti]|uniref:Uncharacterized protein n=1 Tax=Conexibacter stalactiti TaxID=1940611 RepID=A0ABU4HSI1_9ACTN|nr:hypothetical protein [Conexibacter stalactiti]MDW5595694.1 hypothetical protein [Conexibacter stalactiti]MEC5036336.1 hypothetical protein [Conexibacter stalactiti]